MENKSYRDRLQGNLDEACDYIDHFLDKYANERTLHEITTTAKRAYDTMKARIDRHR